MAIGLKLKKEIVVKAAKTYRGPDNDTYQMVQERRGVCMIVSYEYHESPPHCECADNYDGDQDSKGAFVDVESLETLFRQLGFNVITTVNIEDRSMLIDGYCAKYKDKGMNGDMFVAIVLGHRKEKYFLTSNNEEISIQGFIDQFGKDVWKAFAGKPKLFIINTCRGRRAEEVEDIALIRPKDDMIVAQANAPENSFFRNGDQGTAYIQTLCEVFMENAHERELMDLLQLTATRHFDTSQRPGCRLRVRNSNLHHNFSKRLYFNPGFNESNCSVDEEQEDKLEVTSTVALALEMCREMEEGKGGTGIRQVARHDETGGTQVGQPLERRGDAAKAGATSQESTDDEFHHARNFTEDDSRRRTEVSLACINNGTLIIGFRGTDSPADWLDNFCFTLIPKNDENREVRFHKGFMERADKIFKGTPGHRFDWPLVDRIKELYRNEAESSPRKIITTGHSLGGALAQLIHIKLHEAEEIRQMRPSVKLECITFATPMIGNYRAREKFMLPPSKNMTHFILKSDIVPALQLNINQVYGSLPRIANLTVIKGGIDALARKSEDLKVRAAEVKKLVDELSRRGENERDPVNLYAPMGNYFQILEKTAGEAPEWGPSFPYNCDPQEVNSALGPALEKLNTVGSWGAFMSYWYNNPERNPTIAKIIEVHKMTTYDQKCRELLQSPDVQCPHVPRSLAICRETYDKDSVTRKAVGGTYCVFSKEKYEVDMKTPRL